MKIISRQFYLLSIILVLFLSCNENARQISKSKGGNSVPNLANQKVSIDSINIFIDRKMQEMNIPGLSLAIINDGHIAYHTVKGYADKEEKKLVDNQTIFEGASLSKPMFAHMTMFLVEEEKLDLDTPLCEYLDYQYPGTDKKDERYKQITARMVLSHSTGFPNWREGNNLTIQFDPGTNFDYSGEGYIFLEKVLESILDTDYKGLESYFQEKIAKPLNMQFTKFVQDEYNISHKASPYEDDSKLPLNHWDAKEFNAASSIHSEAIDFSKWLIALMEGKGLSEKTYDELFTEQVMVPEESFFGQFGVTAWTLGFAKLNISGHTVYSHLGNNMGFSSLFLIDRDKKWGLVFFSNAHLAQDFGIELFKYLHQEH